MPALFYILRTTAMTKTDKKCCCRRANSSHERATINKINCQMVRSAGRKTIRRRGKRLQFKVGCVLAEKVNLIWEWWGSSDTPIWERKAQVPKSCTLSTPAGRALCISKEPQESHSEVREGRSVRGDVMRSHSEGVEERAGDCQYSALGLRTRTLTEEDGPFQRRHFKGSLWPAVFRAPRNHTHKGRWLGM